MQWGPLLLPGPWQVLRTQARNSLIFTETRGLSVQIAWNMVLHMTGPIRHLDIASGRHKNAVRRTDTSQRIVVKGARWCAGVQRHG